MIIVNLETSLATTVDKACGNASGAIVKRFIRPRAFTIFFHTAYFLDGPGPLILASTPHEEISNSAFGIWIDDKHFFQMDAVYQLE